MIEALIELFNRDLQKLYAEIELYKSEKNLWLISENISNSGGNLCLHLLGNLKTYIGNGLAKTNYERDRQAEFSAKDIPQTTLLAHIQETQTIVYTGLNSLSNNQLRDDFPIQIWDKQTKMDFTLIHLHSHLNYHLGQINYHRRLIDR